MRRFAKAVIFVPLICFLIICALGPLVEAQVSTSPPPKPKVAAKFDEYGQLGGCDHSARLDNFTIALQNDPNADGYILIYGPEGEGWGSGKSQFSSINDYLVNARGLAEDRFKFIYGGRNRDLREPRIELWVAPQGAAPPEPQHFETEIKTFKGKFSDSEAWDDIAVVESEEGPGLPVGSVTLASFADMLKQQSDTVAYIVAYNGLDAVPGAWRRVAARDADSLKQRGVEGGRVRVIYGGKSKHTTVQLWILPNGAAPPAIDAGPEALPEKPVQMGSFSDYMLSSEESQVNVFKDLVGVLRLNDKLRTVIIVRMETPANVEEASVEPDTSKEQSTTTEKQSESAPQALIELPPADFPKLVQKWTASLAAHKIHSDRFIVLFVPAREMEGNTLEMWIAPAGVPLPDPFAEPEPPEVAEDPPQNSDKLKPPKPAQ